MSSAIQLWEIPFHLLFLAAECVLVYAIVLRLRRLAVERSWVDLSGVVLWIVGVNAGFVLAVLILLSARVFLAFTE